MLVKEVCVGRGRCAPGHRREPCQSPCRHRRRRSSLPSRRSRHPSRRSRRRPASSSRGAAASSCPGYRSRPCGPASAGSSRGSRTPAHAKQGVRRVAGTRVHGPSPFAAQGAGRAAGPVSRLVHNLLLLRRHLLHGHLLHGHLSGRRRTGPVRWRRGTHPSQEPLSSGIRVVSRGKAHNPRHCESHLPHGLLLRVARRRRPIAGRRGAVARRRVAWDVTRRGTSFWESERPRVASCWARDTLALHSSAARTCAAGALGHRLRAGPLRHERLGRLAAVHAPLAIPTVAEPSQEVMEGAPPTTDTVQEKDVSKGAPAARLGAHRNRSGAGAGRAPWAEAVSGAPLLPQLCGGFGGDGELAPLRAVVHRVVVGDDGADDALGVRDVGGGEAGGRERGGA